MVSVDESRRFDADADAVAVDAPSSPGASRAGLLVAVAFVALALFETLGAATARFRAPSDVDWRAVEAEVRAGFRPGDLIVAAPAWSDPIMREHLGDLVPRAVAARMDDGRFLRVWEIAQHGARAPETGGAAVALESRHGALTLRRVDRGAAPLVHTDFVAAWTDARFVRVGAAGAEVVCPVEGAAGRLDALPPAPGALPAAPSGVPPPPPRLPVKMRCQDLQPAYLMPETLEVDGALRYALHTEPVAGATLRIEWPAAELGRELVVGSGLHNVWARKLGDGVVEVKVIVDGQLRATLHAGNETGWTLTHIDTSALAGRKVPVHFEIRSARPAFRHLALAAEARG